MVLVAASQEALGDKAPRRPDTMATAEIPVWVNSRQRWVTGVNRKTTCDDVIAVLLKSEGARGGSGGGDGGNGAECGSGVGGASAGAADGHGYAIMERWRRVERPLDGRARILKVWAAWGDAQGEVRLTLRRVDHSEADSGRGSPSREPPAPASGAAPAAAGAAPPAHQRRRRHHHHRSQHHHHHHRHRDRERDRDAKPPWPAPHETVHPRRLAQQLHGAGAGSGSKLPETIERLMKLILQQGETIQSQLRKLQEREHQIEHLEDETHRARVEALGSNYLLETYLGSQLDAEEDEEEKGNDSGVVTEGGSEQASGSSPSSGHDDEAPRCLGARPRVDDDEANFADESDEGTKEQTAAEEGALLDLKTQVDLWEKLVKVNKRLEREEESLVRLHIKFRRLQNERPPPPPQPAVEDAAEGEDAGEGGAAACALRVLPEEELDAEGCQARDALLGELERVRAQLEQGSREMEQTAHALAEAEALLDARRRYLRRLQAELDASDRETDRLQRQIAAAVAAAAANAPVPAPAAPPPPPPSHPPAAIHSAAPAKAKADAPISSANMNDTDSNSDTGLSSLHSGSEEGVYILDTLV